jgi:hypothetical protein
MWMKGEAEMLTFRMIRVLAIGLAVLGAVFARPASAATTTDEKAAILVYPLILGDTTNNVDTTVQIANLDSQLAAAHCFYVNANSHCNNTGGICASSEDCELNGFTGVCRPGWSELNFDIRVTPNQPLVWSAVEGLGGEELPLRANAGTRVPPLPEDPFIGELKCIQTDPNAADRRPAACEGRACLDSFIGQASIQIVDVTPADDDIANVDVASYNAIGIRNDVNDTGSNNGDGNIELGTEYESCPSTLVLNHVFDGAEDPVDETYEFGSYLALVPCSEDLYAQTRETITAQFLVYNEFEQRFSTSRGIDCFLASPLSLIDTSQPPRSIFSAGVAGTVAGQSRIQGVNGGLLGLAALGVFSADDDDDDFATATYNLNQDGDREDGDLIRIP